MTKAVVKNHITFEDYKNCLYEKSQIRKNMRMFQSKEHVMRTVVVNKIALSANDDKRVIQNDNVNTLPYGHYSLKKKNCNFMDYY